MRRRQNKVKFRLYFAADAPNSFQAKANLIELGKRYFPGEHEIEWVDVLREPKRALSDSVFMTPMLIKLSPAPERRVVGTLSETATVLQALGLDGKSE